MNAGTIDRTGVRLLAAPDSLSRAFASALEALATQTRVVALLAFREIKSRFAKSVFSGLVSLIEPALLILVLYLLRSFLMKDVRFGTSLLLFLATGVVPFCLFTNISSGATSAIRSAKRLKSLSIVTPLDFVLAIAVIELMSLGLVYGALFYVASHYDIPEAIPYAPEKVVGAVAAICILAMGVGLFNAGIGAVFAGWKTIYGRLARIFMLTSGVHRVAEYIPYEYRQYMLLNPMMHAIEWFRSAFYHLYPTYSLDITYLWTWAISTFVLGLAFERVVRLHLGGQKKKR